MSEDLESMLHTLEALVGLALDSQRLLSRLGRHILRPVWPVVRFRIELGTDRGTYKASQLSAKSSISAFARFSRANTTQVRDQASS